MTEEANWNQKIEEIEADITELNKLTELSERPKVKDILSKEASILKSRVTKIRNEVQAAEEHKKSQGQQEQKSPEKKSSTSVNYTALTKYSWEDESKKAKIYFSLNNIGNECPGDQVDVEFTKESVELRIRGYQGQNWNFSVKKTFGKIIPEQCKYLVKTNLLSITLTKEKSETWTQLSWKEEKLGKSSKKDDEAADPNASIMNLMKDMYNSGDETMKKTIAEAWTKAQDKKGPDAFKM